jgi:hypothetical protein
VDIEIGTVLRRWPRWEWIFGPLVIISCFVFSAKSSAAGRITFHNSRPTTLLSIAAVLTLQTGRTPTGENGPSHALSIGGWGQRYGETGLLGKDDKNCSPAPFNLTHVSSI